MVIRTRSDSAIVAKMKRAVQQSLSTHYQKECLFRIEIEGQPDDFAIYVKEITHGSPEIETEPQKVGVTGLNYPTGLSPAPLTMTLYDNEDERIYKFVNGLRELVYNKDGTVNLPFGQDGYVKKIKKFNIAEDGTETLAATWEMFVTQCGEITQTYEGNGLMEFSATFSSFRIK
jgi:hypothetical protein